MDNSEQETNNDSDPTEDVATLKLQLELEKLDRRWLEERADLTRGYQPGAEPKAAHGIASGIFFAVLGSVIIGGDMTLFDGPSVPAIVVGTIAICLGVVFAVCFIRKARVYHQAKQRYEDRRQQLLQDITDSRERASVDSGDNNESRRRHPESHRADQQG